MYHIPVMLSECLQALNIQGNENVVDVTFGGGGHSKAILQQLPNGKLWAFDQDADAAANVLNDERFVLIPHNFKNLKQYLQLYGALPVDAILADLGVSSHQFDTATRGFSTRFDAPLDMRMNKQGQETAASLLATLSA
ncbi:MAG TPA: 16S rRNA (cytosine(1402)-N(4))-methyltransferase, partial [Bacteroidia bacterium]|nr:16S rRNA (cytosine(1402)-N(4))-methyltransferase [Bacteroidia bacterium]